MKTIIEMPDVTEEEAREILEDHYGSVMWRRREDGALVAYPSADNNPCAIKAVEPGDITDTDRLNWLEKTDGEVHSDMGAGDGPSTWFAYRKQGNRNDTRFVCFSAPTIRKAIDAAMTSLNTELTGAQRPVER